MIRQITVLFAGLTLFAGCKPHPTHFTFNAATPELADVQAAIDQAQDGDTVTIPAGTAHWTSPLILSKGITLQGQTTVTGNAFDANGFVVNDQTNIIDDITGDYVTKITLTATQHFEMTGLTFQPGTGAGNNYNQLINLSGSPNNQALNRNTRIHHNHFAAVKRRTVVLFGLNYGLFDHNQMELAGATQCVYFTTGFGGTNGNAEWADYAWFGTDKFFFIEDNYVHNITTVLRGLTDCDGTLRCVARYNHLVNCSAGDHGTEGGANRGARAGENYNNLIEFTFFTSTASQGTRSGNKLAHDNTVTKAGVVSFGANINFRAFSGGSGGQWGNADGSSPWDKCVTDVDSGGDLAGGLDQSKQHWIEEHSPYLFLSGTAAADDPATTGDKGTLTVAGTPWTAGQWIGYSVTNLDYPKTGETRGGFIIANTENTITFRRYSSTDRGPINRFVTGNRFQIHRVLKALDAVGSGKGDLVLSSGGTAVNTAYTPNKASWPREMTEPSFTWNNKNSVDDIYLGYNNDPTFSHTGDASSPDGMDLYNLGPAKGATPYPATPDIVKRNLPAEVNGVQYTGTFTYPHPLQSSGGDGTPVPTGTPPSSPAATATPYVTATPNPTPTETPVIAPTATLAPTPAPTATATATATPVATATATAIPTATSSPSVAPTATATPLLLILRPGDQIIISVPPNAR